MPCTGGARQESKDEAPVTRCPCNNLLARVWYNTGVGVSLRVALPLTPASSSSLPSPQSPLLPHPPSPPLSPLQKHQHSHVPTVPDFWPEYLEGYVIFKDLIFKPEPFCRAPFILVTTPAMWKYSYTPSPPRTAGTSKHVRSRALRFKKGLPKWPYWRAKQPKWWWKRPGRLQEPNFFRGEKASLAANTR